jgi:hypothetical protein
MKNAVFWDMAPRGSCKNRRFRGKHRRHIRVKRISKIGTTSISSQRASIDSITANLSHADSFDPDDGGDTFLRKIGPYKCQTPSHPRRWHFSCSKFPCKTLKCVIISESHSDAGFLA